MEWSAMTLLSTQQEAKRQPQLTRDDWIEQGLSVLVEDGVEAVQITHLSRRLGVTRGSFYWHFEDRGDLLNALLEEWRARNTGVMIAALSEAESVAQGILELFSVWIDHNRFDSNLDHAVRDWGRRSAAVRESMSAEDDNRIDAIARFFARHGFEQTDAFVRARVIYFTQLSYYALGVREPMAKRMSYLESYYRCFTGQEIDPTVAEDYRQLLIKMETGA